MGTNAEPRAARERVSAYHQAQLTRLLTNVLEAADRYRAGEIDAYTMDETIHHYHRAAGELWKFCSPAAGAATHSSSLAPSTGWPPMRKPSTGGNAPRHDGASEPRPPP